MRLAKIQNQILDYLSVGDVIWLLVFCLLAGVMFGPIWGQEDALGRSFVVLLLIGAYQVLSEVLSLVVAFWAIPRWPWLVVLFPHTLDKYDCDQVHD